MSIALLLKGLLITGSECRVAYWVEAGFAFLQKGQDTHSLRTSTFSPCQSMDLLVMSMVLSWLKCPATGELWTRRSISYLFLSGTMMSCLPVQAAPFGVDLSPMCSTHLLGLPVAGLFPMWGQTVASPSVPLGSIFVATMGWGVLSPPSVLVILL